MPRRPCAFSAASISFSASGRIATNTWGRSSHCGNGRSPLGQRSPVGNADEVFLEQRLALDVAGRVRKDAERQVDFPSASCASMASRLAWLMASSSRRLGAQPQQRQQQVRRIVGQREAKAAHRREASNSPCATAR